MANRWWPDFCRQAPTPRQRGDVENRETFDPLRVIERQTICDPAAAIMSRSREARESEPLHDGGHFVRHGSLRVRRVTRVGG